MKGAVLYEQVPELKLPWSVKKVAFSLAGPWAVVEVVLKKGQMWAGPTDPTRRARVNGWSDRRWRHLDTCQFQTPIKARIPQLEYSHVTVEELTVPWVERYSRGTPMMAGLVIQLLEACPATRAICRLMRLSWGTVNAIMVSAGLLETLTRAYARSQGLNRVRSAVPHMVTVSCLNK